jgi:hypothetical protein
MEIGRTSQVLLAALGIFCFWRKEREEFTTENTEGTEK